MIIKTKIHHSTAVIKYLLYIYIYIYIYFFNAACCIIKLVVVAVVEQVVLRGTTNRPLGKRRLSGFIQRVFVFRVIIICASIASWWILPKSYSFRYFFLDYFSCYHKMSQIPTALTFI